MRTTLDIDEDVVAVARGLAADSKRSLGAVISDLARRGMSQSWIEMDGDFPVFRSPPGSPPITEEMVRRALDED